MRTICYCFVNRSKIGPSQWVGYDKSKVDFCNSIRAEPHWAHAKLWGVEENYMLSKSLLETTLYLGIFLERSKPHFRCTLCMYFLCVTKGQQRSFCLVNTKVSIFQKDTQLVLLRKDDSWLVQYYLNIFSMRCKQPIIYKLWLDFF